MELVILFLCFILGHIISNLIFGYRKVSKEEWIFIQRLRVLDDLEPDTWE